MRPGMCPTTNLEMTTNITVVRQAHHVLREDRWFRRASEATGAALAFALELESARNLRLVATPPRHGVTPGGFPIRVNDLSEYV